MNYTNCVLQFENNIAENGDSNASHFVENIGLILGVQSNITFSTKKVFFLQKLKKLTKD